ncbi:hypothetical protein LTR12_002329 [Friedmanniomyces endolithicus]|uniref:Thioredoxin-like fold domain-containing protein n=1 Tax=Friedmanniomyces endolithicus TaxID=329885 RepID=A0A4U0VGT2_9PEZI|nr:hypothetical protein LTS09_006286 [Friedmanniomyces endolithicus]KAK1823256.1 hypothetical protein LTR12_002329 [Friedmanniomyces endolithicus]TKA48183.1 hypothetical protein B0A54_01676 [Friedmanniomyces endolithicus]
MALNPRFAGQKLAAHVSPYTMHTLEFYWDYVCPYSKKMFDTVYDGVFPIVKQKYADKVQFIFRQQIQPWHPSSTLVHEAGAAVLQTDPDKFWEFSKALFGKSAEYYDVKVVNETRNATYERLSKLAESVGIDGKKIYSLLKISDQPDKDGGLNTGNSVTNDVKLMVKANRLTGVHVTPTVLFNGVVEGGISSSFTKEEWEQWLEKNIT